MTKTVFSDVLVIGGGIAGLQAAKKLSELGLKVFLAERESFLGGKLNFFAKVFPDNSQPGKFLGELIDSVIKDENIQVQTKAVVKEVNGKFKGFNVKIESTGSSKKPVEIDLKASAIIVATGYHLFDAEKMPQFYYGKHGNVLTGLDFEEMFKDNILNQKPFLDQVIRVN